LNIQTPEFFHEQKMNIIVCVKQVPDTIKVNVKEETNTPIREGADSIINPFDLHAIEEGLRIREQYGGVVTVLSMRLGQAIATLREALSIGVDNAVLPTDVLFAGADNPRYFLRFGQLPTPSFHRRTGVLYSIASWLS